MILILENVIVNDDFDGCVVAEEADDYNDL